MSEAVACADGSSLCDLPEEVACEPFSCSELDIPDFIKTVDVGKSLHLNSQVNLLPGSKAQAQVQTQIEFESDH